MKHRHNKYTLFLISEALAFVFAIAFAAVLLLAIRPFDGAYGDRFLADLVAKIVFFYALIAGLFAWPFVYFALRDRSLRRCLPMVLGIPLAWIVVATPFAPEIGFVGSFFALGAALVLCASRFPRIYPAGCCKQCGYDLTGNVSGRCPECGAAAMAGSHAGPSE